MQASTRAIGRGAALIEPGKPAHQDAGRAGAAPDRVRQNGGKFRRLARIEIARRLAERPARAGLGAELAVRAPLGDVEIDFHNPPLRQHQIDPQREREFERFAHEAAPGPQEQIFGGLLGEGRGAARFADLLGLLQRLAHGAEVDAAIAAKAAVLGDDHGERQRRRDAGRAASRCARRARRSHSATASASRPDRRPGKTARST